MTMLNIDTILSIGSEAEFEACALELFPLPTELWHHSVFSNAVLFGAAKVAFFIK